MPARAPASASAASAPSAATLLAANRRGIQFMVAGMACFIVNDALVKFVSQSLLPAQLICVRGAIATLLVYAVARASGATPQLPAIAGGWVALRASVEAIASVMYLLSLFHLPLGNATAINLAAPLAITAFAVWFLHEQVDARRWVAIGVGFAGVFMVIQPRLEGFNGWALLCLSATLLHATRDLLTRRIPATIPSILVTLATAISVTVLAGAWSLVQGWQPLSALSLGMLACAAAFLAAGYYLLIRATREGEFSVIAPFRYTGLLWALAIGWVIWGEVPNPLAWLGIALLIGAGLYLIHRERQRARERAAGR
jgi:drug/metabolite transporter (DMT)-like permease